jgi:hypothetical protein
MDAYQGLRNLVLTHRPADLGLAPRAPLDSVWGALVDIAAFDGASWGSCLGEVTRRIAAAAGAAA